jgi:hypothetical protein
MVAFRSAKGRAFAERKATMTSVPIRGAESCSTNGTFFVLAGADSMRAATGPFSERRHVPSTVSLESGEILREDPTFTQARLGAAVAGTT